MLPWFSARFPVRALVSIFRHPCAVVASQMAYQSGWRNATPPGEEKIKEGFFGTLPDPILERFGDTLSDVNTTAGYLAAVWSLDVCMALQGPIRGCWIVATYENLVENTELVMRSVLNSIGAPMPTGMRERFGEPSNSAAEDLKTEDVNAQLTKWRRRLNSEQVDAILQTTHAFGLDFYTEGPQPDRNRLDVLVEDASHDGYHLI